jgi:feruloyl esterase
VLTCKGPDAATCLLPPQVEALKKIYDGPKNPRTGQQIYPGIPPGTEAATWGNWIAAADPTKSIQAVLGNPYYGQAVFEDLKWDVRTMDFDKDFAYGETKAAPILNSSSPDLRSFRARNGKIIQYHGWGDSAISAFASIEYYKATSAFMSKVPDARKPAAAPIDDFYRLFMVPGMAHCAGGLGPNAFGNRGAVSPATAHDPERDIFAALERWVEKGTAPEQLIGVGPGVGGDPSKTLTRPICLFPKVANYKGTGDINDAANFACVASDARR